MIKNGLIPKQINLHGSFKLIKEFLLKTNNSSQLFSALSSEPYHMFNLKKKNLTSIKYFTFANGNIQI